MQNKFDWLLSNVVYVFKSIKKNLLNELFLLLPNKNMQSKLIRILKADKDFTPFPVAEGEELFPNGIFKFNITKMFEFIEKNPDHITIEEVAYSIENQHQLRCKTAT